MSKITSVEYLFGMLLQHLDMNNAEDRIRFRQYEQNALNIHREEVVNAWSSGAYGSGEFIHYWDNGDEYYDETFKLKKQ